MGNDLLLSYVSRKPKPCFAKTVTFAEHRLYRRIIARGLRCTERALMTKLSNLWFRHRQDKAPIAPGYGYLARQLDVTEKTVQRTMARLVQKGFVRFIGGGDGAGRKCRYAVDLTRIREVLAPDLLVDKGDNSGGAHIAKGKRQEFRRACLWGFGLYGRSAQFRTRLVRCLMNDSRAMWRRFAPPPRSQHGLVSGHRLRVSTAPAAPFYGSMRQMA